MRTIKKSNLIKVFPNIQKKPWHHKLKWNAKSIKVLKRLIVDSTYDKVFPHNIKAVSTNSCDICNVPEYAEHMIFECQKCTNNALSIPPG